MVENTILEMSRLARERAAVDLAQGFPDFPAPQVLKDVACRAISEDFNQYSQTPGTDALRQAIAAKYKRHYGLEVDPATEITVCCGATEAMIASLLAVSNPGEDIIIFEPYFASFGLDALLCSLNCQFVRLYPPAWRFDPDELRQAFSAKTKAVIVNSPNNPSGRVFDRSELSIIAALCQEFDAIAITDEIYEHILYDGARHIPLMSMDGMRDRTVLISSLSKTYSVAGWRVGWLLASPDITESIRRVHEVLTVGAPTPFQEAGVVALSSDDAYYTQLASEYEQRRAKLFNALQGVGLNCQLPEGAYYIMVDISESGFSDDVQFVRNLIENVGVAAVPGSGFFSRRECGSNWVRFCFPKKLTTLEQAEARLRDSKLSRLAALPL